jgi:hypothetical protein
MNETMRNHPDGAGKCPVIEKSPVGQSAHEEPCPMPSLPPARNLDITSGFAGAFGADRILVTQSILRAEGPFASRTHSRGGWRGIGAVIA